MNASKPHLVVIGVGLIGGSVARALRASGFVSRVTGVGRNVKNLQRAEELNVVDHWTTDAAAAVSDADIVLLATPVGSYDAIFAEIAGHLPESAVVTDAGSTKQCVLEAAGKHFKSLARFVPAHPIAGTEKSGVEASFAELFKDRLCVLTPLPETDEDALQLVQQMWKATGSRLCEMPANEHDDFLAAVSHLPHLLAYGLVNTVRKVGTGKHDPFRFAAGGFRDFSRIASSSPEMWRDIVMTNRQAVLEKLGLLQSELDAMRTMLQDSDAEALLNEFKSAKQARDEWLKTHGGSL